MKILLVEDEEEIGGLIKDGLEKEEFSVDYCCLLYTSPSPRDLSTSRMPSSA